MAGKISNIITSFFDERSRIFLRETGYLGKQRLVAFMIYTIVIIAGTMSHILGITGISNDLFKILNVLYLVVTLLAVEFYVTRFITIRTALYITTNFSHLILAIETLVFTISGTPNSMPFAMGTLVLMAFNHLFSFAALLRYNSYILSGETFLVCLVCICFFQGNPVSYYICTFLLSVVMVSVLGERLAADANLLASRDARYKKHEEEIALRMRTNWEEIDACMQLAQNRMSSKHINQTLEKIRPMQVGNLVHNVNTFMKERQERLDDLSQLFPGLTPSEIAICKLIMQDKKQGEICALLHKTKGNVNTQRAHIRKKLDIPAEESLADALHRIADSR